VTAPAGVRASSSARPAVGTVYLVGAGPGDPGLLTVRARELLDTCDAVVYDALANPEILRSAEGDGEDGRELHFVGKRGGDGGSTRQEDINALLVRLARDGKRVVRLKGGDPLVFGRGSEEAQALVAAGVPFELVPGVTAGIAAPAYAGIPVTHRGLATSVTFVTGHEDPTKDDTQTDWHALARAGGTIVLYMGVKRLPSIAADLMAGGLPPDTPAAAIQWGTYPRQRTIVATLATLAKRASAERLAAPMIIVIGRSVSLRSQIAWFDARPLFGRRIVVTRSRPQASALTERLRAFGAEVLEMPATRIEPLDPRPLQRAIDRLGNYGWAIFTSQNAVRLFWGVLRDRGRDARALAGLKVAAVGAATAEALLERGIAVDVLPERFVAEGVLEALARREDVRGARVLYATADGARDVLPAGLTRMGAVVDALPVYRSVPDGEGAEPLRLALTEGSVDLVTFTSASTVHGFVQAVGVELAARAPAASIGPITSDAARQAGISVTIEAGESTIPGLVDAIVAGVTASSRITAASDGSAPLA
jgi:uroporphyrinogen III methyltransferase/synthase